MHVLQTLINAFSEGISLASSSVDMNPSVQTSNGFELIRQLTLEYSIRTRNEALTFRTALANKTFALSASETSPSSVVTDTNRRIDYEAARCQKLIGTLPSTVNTVGLQMAETDLVSISLRSLPDTVKGFVVHHSDGKVTLHIAMQHKSGRDSNACFRIWVFQARSNFTN